MFHFDIWIMTIDSGFHKIQVDESVESNDLAYLGYDMYY